MSKMSKSKSNREKKKKTGSNAKSKAKSRSKSRNSSARKGKTAQKSIEQVKVNVEEQLNNENADELLKTEENVVSSSDDQLKINVYDPEESDRPESVTEESIESGSELEENSEPEPEIEEVAEPEPEAERETEPELKTEEDSEPEPETEEEPGNEQKSIYRIKKKRHRRTGLKVIGVLALLLIYCGAAIAGIFAVDKYIVDPDTYPNGTTINNVDVSGMTVNEAEDALTKEWNTRSITFFDSSSREIGEITKFDFDYDIDEQLEHALSPGAEKAISRFFKKDKEDIHVTMTPEKSTKLFDRQFNDLSIVKSAKGDKPSKNAYIDKSDTEFRIVKEVIGNSVDTRLLKKAVLKSIAEGNETFKYRRSDYHLLPEIVSTSESLLDERKYCVKYLSFSIRLRNPVDDYTIPPSWLDKMITVSKNGDVKVNDEQVSTFISDTLYPKFSSVGGTRRLKSAGGGMYTITGGTYGYTVDVEKEHEVLTSELKKREDVEREPYYSGKTPGKNWQNDIGNDFVEVSIEKQNVWVVRNGKVIVDTPVVTGNVPRHNTPTGVFYIVYKATNTTLKGRNDDGSKYESHVAYWMPFYLGFGLHDASWRGYFGGSIYMGNGSHGCVNCPPPIMPKIFSNCYEGMPVIVH